MNPLISVITPAFNAEKFIEATIESVQKQSYQNWEHLIVVDRMTTDQTRDLVIGYAQRDQRIRLIEDPVARGVSENRNLAIANANGDYLAFLDADDLWHPEKLTRQIRFMLSKDAAFSFHSHGQVSESGVPKPFIRDAPHTVTYHQLLKHNCIGCLTVMLKKSALAELKFTNEMHEDFCLWLDLLKRLPHAYGMSDLLASYRLVANSRSNNKFKSALWRWNILRKRERLSLATCVIYFAVYALASIKLRS